MLAYSSVDCVCVFLFSEQILLPIAIAGDVEMASLYGDSKAAPAFEMMNSPFARRGGASAKHLSIQNAW